jgi:hypothetical protein
VYPVGSLVNAGRVDEISWEATEVRRDTEHRVHIGNRVLRRCAKTERACWNVQWNERNDCGTKELNDGR